MSNKKQYTSKQNPNSLKIALVHDYLREFGGAERVLEELHHIFPDAPVYVAFYDKKSLGVHWKRYANWKIRTTWMQFIPGIHSLFSPLRFLAPIAFSNLDLSGYDLVISSSNAYYAKAVNVSVGKHICYCHTPPRSLYGYSTMSDWKKNTLIRIFGEILNHYLRFVDYNIAQKVDYFIANSLETQKRISKFYQRKSTIIFPPVEIPEKLSNLKTQKKYFLYVNRLAFAKHPEIAVVACQELDISLKVVGVGPLFDELKQQAGPKIEFLGAVDDDKLHQLYQDAQALIYPVEDEDFGMIPVEAMGYGVPVIAHRSGGPKETIAEEKTGIFFDELSVRGLKEAIHLFKSYKWDAQKIHQHSQQFSREMFDQQILTFIKKWNEKNGQE